MQFLSQVRITTRLGAGFAIVLLLGLAGTAGALLNARHTAEATRAMMAKPLAKERAISDWLGLIQAANTRTAFIARSSDTTLATTFADVIADGTKKGTALMKQIEGLVETDAERALFDQIVRQRARNQDAKKHVMDAKKAGDEEAAGRLYKDEFGPATDAYLAAVKGMLDEQRRAIDATAAAIDAANAGSTRWMLVLTALLVAAAGLCAWAISRSITRPLHQAVDVANTVAAGDLTHRFDERTARDEIGDLMQSLRGMNDALGAMVRDVQGGTAAIEQDAERIAAGNLDLSARTEQQAGSLEETASTMEQLTGTVRQNADNAHQANALAQAASNVATRGGAIVGQVVQTMDSIDASSRRIVDIIATIDGIAFQTNILALNAAVEAARAGEQGRGFAVVATEVRNLAQRSASAAKDIKLLIDDSTGKAGAGSRLVNEAGGTMQEIVDSIRRVADLMGEISAASGEQSAGIEQINGAVVQMDQVTQQNAALVEETSAAADAMRMQAAKLAEAVAVFRTGDVVAPVALATPRAVKAQARADLPSAAPRVAATLAKPAAPRKAQLASTAGDDWEAF